MENTLTIIYINKSKFLSINKTIQIYKFALYKCLKGRYLLIFHTQSQSSFYNNHLLIIRIVC